MNRFTSTASSLAHVWVLLFLSFPTFFLLYALRLRKRLRGESLLSTPLKDRPTYSPLSQPVEVSPGLDDFEPDDELTQVWLEILTDDPITFISTTNHLDRCYEAPDGQSATNSRRHS